MTMRSTVYRVLECVSWLCVRMDRAAGRAASGVQRYVKSVHMTPRHMTPELPVERRHATARHEANRLMRRSMKPAA